jgi:DNA-binding NarL/FixJ family response regulator
MRSSGCDVTLVAEATIKTHVAKLLDKLAGRDRVQLAVLALRRG